MAEKPVPLITIHVATEHQPAGIWYFRGARNTLVFVPKVKGDHATELDADDAEQATLMAMIYLGGMGRDGARSRRDARKRKRPVKS